MSKQVLVIGGCGRIGNSVAQDIANHTDAEVTITSRNPQQQAKLPFKFLTLDLADRDQLEKALSSND